MSMKFKFLPVLALGLCWMTISDGARAQDCESAYKACQKWYSDGGKTDNKEGCAGYKSLCDNGSNVTAFVGCMTGYAGAGDCNVAFSAQSGPACDVAKNACK